MHNRFLILFLAISSFLTAQNTGSFSGQVIDEKTQDPLEGATVILEDTTLGVITDASGYFTFENVQ